MNKQIKIRVTYKHDVDRKIHLYQGWLDEDKVGKQVAISEFELMNRGVSPRQVADTLMVTLMKSAEKTISDVMEKAKEDDGQPADDDGIVINIHQRQEPDTAQ